MHQHVVDVLVDDVGRFARAVHAALVHQDVAHRDRDHRLGERRGREVQQRQQLEAELAAAERIHLEQHDVGLGRVERIEQLLLALDLPALVDLVAVLVEQVGELRIRRDRRRQLHHPRAWRRDARDRRAAEHEIDLGPGVDQRPRNRRGPLEMPDAEQMLHVEEDAGGSHRRTVRATPHILSLPALSRGIQLPRAAPTLARSELRPSRRSRATVGRWTPAQGRG